MAEFMLYYCYHCQRDICRTCARKPIDIDDKTGAERPWGQIVCMDKAAEWTLSNDKSIRTEVLS